MFCSHCGTKLNEGAAFCSACGGKVGEPTYPAHHSQPSEPVRSVPIFETPGRNFLKVAGILYIVFAGLTLLSAIGLMGVADVMSGIGGVFGMGDAGGNVRLLSIYGFISGGWWIFMGVMGIKHCATRDPEDLRTLGIIDLIHQAVAGFLITGFNFMLVLSLVIPILYIVGAHKNLNADVQWSRNDKKHSSYSLTGFWRCSYCDAKNPSSSRFCQKCKKSKG